MAKKRRVVSHHHSPLRLGDFVLSQIKRLADRHLVEGFVLFMALRFRRRAHLERACLNPYKFHRQTVNQVLALRSKRHLQMLRALMPLKPHALPRRGKIQHPDLGARPSHKLLPGGRHLERAPRKFHPVVVSYGGVSPVPQMRPVLDRTKAVVCVATHPGGIEPLIAVRQGNRVSTIKTNRKRPVGFTLPTRDDPDTRQLGSITGNLKHCGMNQSRNQNNQATKTE